MDKQEFTQRVLAMENRLYRVSRSLLREPQDQMDAVQEAIARAWERRENLRRPQLFEAWLTRILINACYDQLRAGKRVIQMEEIAEQIAPESGDPKLRDALDALEKELRIPIALYYIEGYRIREVAKILELPESAIKARLAKARRKLRKLLDEEEERA